jgi:hypothetical protein
MDKPAGAGNVGPELGPELAQAEAAADDEIVAVALRRTAM